MDRTHLQTRVGSPTLPALPFYQAHGALSDPGRHAPAIGALPDDVSALAGVVRGLLIHVEWSHLYGLTPRDVPAASRETLPVAQRLHAILSPEGGSLPHARPAR